MDNAHPVVFEPFPYLTKLRDHFKARPKTWNWFSEEANKAQQIKEFRTELLKNTYRLDHESHNELYAICDEVCKCLSIDAEVTLYQENNSVQLNAGISIIGKEAHVVLSGNVLNILDDQEFKALIGHELTHYLFYKIDDEDFETTQRIVLALANDARSEDAIIETARRFQLYMELFCDVGAFKACNDYGAVIQTLVKVNTGLHQVNADSYLKQAEEILSHDTSATQQGTHPECYIRSIALKMATEKNDAYHEKLHSLIEGKLDINRIDIFDQVALQDFTHDLLQCIVSPAWINSAAVQNLCKEYFENFYKSDKHRSITELSEVLEKSKDSVKAYVSYMLLDFAKVDSSLERIPLGFSFEIAELLNIIDIYEKLLRKELKLTVRDFKLLKKDALSDLQKMKESQEESLYRE